MVATNDIAVIASFSTKVANPKDAGRGVPSLLVGTVGGFSWELVSVANRIVLAWPLTLMRSRARTMSKVRGRNGIVQAPSEWGRADAAARCTRCSNAPINPAIKSD